MCEPNSFLLRIVTTRRLFLILTLFGAAIASGGASSAQPAANPGPANFNPGPGNLPNVLGPGGPAPNGLANPNANASPALGGAQNADFESLMDLITSTVHPETWADNGGPADLRPFYGGVLVDASGTLALRENSGASNDLVVKRGRAPVEVAVSEGSGTSETQLSAKKESALRYVSLPRLEREIARRQADHKPLDVSMLTLAGLQRVRYVFVYPETGDLVVAGPAGNWTADDGRIVSVRTRRPVVRLDDFLVLLRRDNAADSFFGCSINPRQDALGDAQKFLASSSQKPIQPGQRKRWLEDLRETVGKQDIEIFGVDPTSHVASILVEADYHMKLIGMGLVDGVNGIDSYLDSVESEMKRAGASPPPMSVLRWWFALHYQSIKSSPEGNAFELVGQGVRLLSENEMLAAQGRRVHTGKSEPLNREFTEKFTQQFEALATKYPIYGELRNVFDLAMAIALVEKEGLAKRVEWSPTIFASNEKLTLPQAPVPRTVDTVISHRIVDKTQFVAGVSGGVMIAPADELDRASETKQISARSQSPPKPDETSAEMWWWDGE
jgi:hypothetical protein